MKLCGYTPRPTQREIFAAPERFLAVDAGRRWGKTLTGLNWGLEGICREGGPIWWVAPTFSQSKMVYRTLTSAARAGTAHSAIRSASDTELRVEFINGQVFEFKTGDNPDNLRGAGIRRAILDEAARLKREIYEEVIRPAVSDTHGRILFLTTPKGKNWFYELWLRGLDDSDPEFRSWKFPTWDNPKVSPEDIAQARASLPADVFAQEYAAEFLDNAAGVFRGVREAIGSERREPEKGREYFAGLDLARLTDFTVLTILNDAGEQVFFDRYNTLDWAVQKARIIRDVELYDARLLVDSTGIGDPIFDDLARAGLTVEGYKFTNISKKKLIEALMMGFEQHKLRILDEQTQTSELEIFEYEIGKGGLVHYSAPQGYHDDCAIALALAFWPLRPGRIEPRIWT